MARVRKMGYCRWCGSDYAQRRIDRPARYCSPECRNRGRSWDTLTRAVKGCSTCKQVKPLDDFTRDRTVPGGRRARCRECSSSSYRAWFIERTYGITLDEYDRLLASQGGVCAICAAEPNADAKAFAVDHNHKTGMVRGILCQSCNLGIGQMGEDVDRFHLGGHLPNGAPRRPRRGPLIRCATCF